MKIKQITILTGALALTLGLSSCGKDSDEEAPKITQVKINGSAATDHMHVDAGTTMTVEVTMTDNEALNQLKIDLHPNDDGHTHGDDSESEGGADGSWEVLEITNLSGTEQTVTRSYAVPNDIRGEWHLGILAIDEEGNEADEFFTDIDIENEIIPLIQVETINGVAPGDEFDTAEGETIMFTGTVSDDNGLAHIHVEIYDEDGNELWSEEFDAAGALTWDLSQISLTVPAIATPHADLYIHAEDIDDFDSEWEIELHLE